MTTHECVPSHWKAAAARYGCGLGDDLRFLAALGIKGDGWDPNHRPHTLLRKTPVVNLGYVINVIENPTERQEVLLKAWALTKEVLIISARLAIEAKFLGETQLFADGYLTGRGTFQKLYEQQELRTWIDNTLGISCFPAAPGVFYAFRDEQVLNAFAASRYQRRLSAPRIDRSEQFYREHADALQPLIEFVSERGRLPAEDELTNADMVRNIFGSIRRAFGVVRRVTASQKWSDITEKRKEDLLIYLALTRFGGRPAFSKLSRAIQGDVKGLFGTYRGGCSEADGLLYSLGRPGTTQTEMQRSEIGKLTPSALYVHVSALPALSPILRLFEGCARAYLGEVEGANIIKLHRDEPIVSYLSYPDFEANPHPALALSLTVHLQTFRIRVRDYRAQENAPILHRKELFVAPQHPLHAKFARLTRIEESKGLYSETNKIGLREDWNRLLREKGLALKGHRLMSAAKTKS
ncbi:MAG: DNA phosphorothioation-associated putative methyltransferase [Ferrovibrio sp.]|uniref:DNA phosphorothioation-associated putative methyltransferase n=1 Tax=Ferrovibrio sp. TaxID=1917215 RepID=UPI00391D3AB7